MKKFNDYIQKNKGLVAVLLLFSIVFGAFSFLNIPKQSFPSLEMPLIKIDVIAPGYNASEVNDEIIVPIENQVALMDGVDMTQSYSFASGGTILVSFGIQEEVDITKRYETLDHQISTLNFPEDVKVTYNTDFYESHAILAVTGENQKEVAESLKKDLSEIEEVDEIRINPNIERELSITADIDKLTLYNISYPQLIELLSAQGVEVPLGYTKDNGKDVPVVSTNSFSSIEELENLVLFVNPQSGQSVMLKDIAVVESKFTNDSYFEHNSQTATFVQIYFKAGKDYTKVGTDIDKIIDSNDESKNIHKVSFQPDDVKVEINKIFTNLLQSIALVFIIVLLGLGIRNSLIISVAFPFVIMSTIGMLYLFGMDLQKISIAGLIISIGIIVDNAIVMSETIQYHVDNGRSTKDALKLSLKQNFTALFTSTLTTIAAFTPLLFLPGIAGSIAMSLPTTVIIALIFSFVFSVMILPVLASKLAKAKKRKNVETSITKDYSRTTKFFKKVYNKPKSVIIIAIVVAGLMIATITQLVVQVFPTADQNIVYITYTNKQSSSTEDTKVLEEEMIEYINSLDYMNDDNVESYTSVVAGNMPQYYSTLPVLPLNSNQGYIYIQTDINKTSEIKEDLTQDLSREFIDKAVVVVGEVELNSPVAPVTVIVSGSNYEEMISYAEEKLEEIEKLEGISKVNYNLPTKNNMYEVVYNEEFLRMNGIQPIQVEQNIALYLNEYGLEIVDIDEYSDVAYINTSISNIDELRNTSFIINGAVYTSTQLFNVEVSEAYGFYARQDYELSLTISIYNDSDTSAIALQNDVDEFMNKNKPDDIKISYESESSLASDVFGDVGIAAFAAFVLIGIILIFEFKKFRNIFAILISIPLSISGSVFILFAFNIPLTFSVALGITSLLGIVVNNGILLVSYIEEYSSQFDNLLEACAVGTKRRLRPILISNITTMFGLIPLMISNSSFFQPMAITLFGGLFTGVVFTIFVTPSAYYLFNKNNK